MLSIQERQALIRRMERQRRRADLTEGEREVAALHIRNLIAIQRRALAKIAVDTPPH